VRRESLQDFFKTENKFIDYCSDHELLSGIDIKFWSLEEELSQEKFDEEFTRKQEEETEQQKEHLLQEINEIDQKMCIALHCLRREKTSLLLAAIREVQRDRALGAQVGAFKARQAAEAAAVRAADVRKVAEAAEASADEARKARQAVEARISEACKAEETLKHGVKRNILECSEEPPAKRVKHDIKIARAKIKARRHRIRRPFGPRTKG
jgi:hypothetical protein